MDDAGKLKQLFKVTQAVMKSRHEQVEEAMDEMEKEAKVSKKKGIHICLKHVIVLTQQQQVNGALCYLSFYFPILLKIYFEMSVWFHFSEQELLKEQKELEKKIQDLEVSGAMLVFSPDNVLVIVSLWDMFKV